MLKVIFREEDHRYIAIDDETGKELCDLVSVTTLLKRHGIAPDYVAVDKDVLKAKAERGKVIHKELEDYITLGEIGFTEELEHFIKQCASKNIKPLKSEFLVYNDEIAGTADVAGLIGEDEVPFIGDFKTTATLHKVAVAWQLSLYAYLNKEVEYKKFLCFHFPDEKTCKVIELEPISTEEIEELLRCERDCELYKPKTLELAEYETEKIIAVQSELKALNDRKKLLEEQENELKEFLISKMEETGVKQIDNDYFKITYVASSTRESVDTSKLKKEMPEIAEKYLKTSAVKASVRITLKDA